MRINIQCPFAEKDDARLLGARWDPVRKTWYIVNVEDLTPFMRWIKPAESSIERVTLREFLADNYVGSVKALTAKAARAFGVPYPLESGWAKKYAARSVDKDAAGDLVGLRRAKKAGSTKPKARAPDAGPVVTNSCAAVEDCGCDHILPWEDCEHTEAAAAAALEEILA